MASSPVLSVIVPVYNDPIGLRQTLSSLADQNNSPVFEIIVVDNGSTDETPSVIKEFEKKYPEIVIGCKEDEIQSSYAARNTGVTYASGKILAFLDADVTVGNGWNSDIYRIFQEGNIDYLGCNVEMYIPEGENTFWARYDVAMGLPVEHYLKSKQFAPTCALVIREEIIEQVGKFDQSLVSGGDKEFGKRVHSAGFNMGYAADIVVRHPARTTLGAHLKKATRIGKGQVQLWDRYNLAVHPLSPIRLLPPSPHRIKNRTQESRTPLLIYLISYILKIVQTIQSIKVYSQLRRRC